MAVKEQDQDDGDEPDVDPRTKRAATEDLVVARGDGHCEYEVYSVTAPNDRYIVNSVTKWCECPDWEYRQPDGGCKHYRRVKLTLGEMEIPDVEDVDQVLVKQREKGV